MSLADVLNISGFNLFPDKIVAAPPKTPPIIISHQLGPDTFLNQVYQRSSYMCIVKLNRIRSK